MIFNLGLKALKRVVGDQKALDWHKNKVTASLFVGSELEAFEWVQAHLTKYHQLPQLDTLCQQFPEFTQMDCPEPFVYYLDLLQKRYGYNRINSANLESQKILKGDKNLVEEATAVMQKAVEDIKSQAYRTKILDVAKEAPKLVLTEYHNALQNDKLAEFGWDYLDGMTGGVMPGDVISFVGRPAMGKTWKVLRMALHNWLAGRTTMVVSMEMNVLAISQRLAAMYTHCPVGQLKLGGYSSQTYSNFASGLVQMAQEKGHFYVVDGNLAASVEDIYLLASQLGAKLVLIDGAYLLKHKNTRLDRYTRVAENVELMKQASTGLEIATASSWQLNRDAAKNAKKTGQQAGLEDIGYSDAIGQISSVVLALMQEEGIETMMQRRIDVLKGRNGEVGQFSIWWDFMKMNFDQVQEGSDEQPMALNYI